MWKNAIEMAVSANGSSVVDIEFQYKFINIVLFFAPEQLLHAEEYIE